MICIRRCITSWKILFWLIYKLVHRYCVELNYNWNNTKSIIKVRYNYQRFSKVWLLRTLYDDVMLHNLYINHTLWLSNSHTMLFSKFIIIFTIAQRNMIFTRSKSCREGFLGKNFLPKPQNQVHFNFFLFVCSPSPLWDNNLWNPYPTRDQLGLSWFVEILPTGHLFGWISK